MGGIQMFFLVSVSVAAVSFVNANPLVNSILVCGDRTSQKSNDPKFLLPLPLFNGALSMKDLEISIKDKKIEELQHQLNEQINITKRLFVTYYFRIRIDHLQWLMKEDKQVRTLMKGIDKHTIPVPDGIVKGKESYISRYRTWLAIAKAMQNTNSTFLLQVKNIFESVGVDVTKIESFAPTAAMLFCKLADEAKLNNGLINEEEIVAVLKYWYIQDEDQLKLARAFLV